MARENWSTVMCVLLILMTSVKHSVQQNEQKCSTNVSQPGVNERMCYRTMSTSQTGVCSTQLRINQTITFLPQAGNMMAQQSKIWSPRFLRGGNYQNNRLCRYHAACPNSSHVMYYSWLNGNFQLQGAINGTCYDCLQIEGASMAYCGNQSALNATRVNSQQLHVQFQSNNVDRFKGFQLDILCVPPTYTPNGSFLAVCDDQCTEVSGVRRQRMCGDVPNIAPDPNAIHPSDVPNDEEVRLISILLNATQPFFADEDICDVSVKFGDSLEEVAECPPPLNITFLEKIDPMALTLAQTHREACNTFLRGAVTSYLEILQEECLNSSDVDPQSCNYNDFDLLNGGGVSTDHMTYLQSSILCSLLMFSILFV